jgi:hypothetical protein
MNYPRKNAKERKDSICITQTWYLEGRAASEGKSPKDIQPFLSWNLFVGRRALLAERSFTAETS